MLGCFLDFIDIIMDEIFNIILNFYFKKRNNKNIRVYK